MKDDDRWQKMWDSMSDGDQPNTIQIDGGLIRDWAHAEWVKTPYATNDPEEAFKAGFTAATNIFCREGIEMTDPIHDWLISQVSRPWAPGEDPNRYKAYLDLLRLYRYGFLDEIIDFLGKCECEIPEAKNAKPGVKTIWLGEK